MGWIKRAWRGEEKLWVVFWIYGTLLEIPVVFIEASAEAPAKPWEFIGLSSFLLIAGIWWVVSLWRCAFNLEWPQFWGYIARVVVIFKSLALIGVLISLVGMTWLLVSGKAGEGTLKIGMECAQAGRQYEANGGTNVEDYKKNCARINMLKKMSETDPSVATCLKTMTDYAQKNDTDPQKYIVNNLVYLNQCVEYYNAKNIATTKKP